MSLLKQILSLFEGNPGVELNAQNIVSKVYPEIDNFNDIIVDSYTSKIEKSDARNKISVLKRRVLYYLNKLKTKGLIDLVSVDSSGRKFYSLNQSNFATNSNNSILEKESYPVLPIDSLENKNMVFRLDENHFFDRVNSILLFDYFDLSMNKLLSYIHDLFSEVNDVIGLYNFERIIDSFETDDLIYFLENLNEDLEIYNKRVCLIVNFGLISDSDKFISFLEKFNFNSKGLIFIWDVNGRNFLKNSNAIGILIDKFSYFSGKLNFKNSNVTKKIFLLGKFGPYLFENDRLLNAKKEGAKGVVVTQSSLILDVKKIHGVKKAKGLSEDIKLSAKSFLYLSNYQRKHLEVLARKLNSNLLFNYSNNLIRLWNYEVFDTLLDNIHLLNSLDSIKNEINEFARTEEIIFMSCGLPIKFKVNLSIAYRHQDVSILNNSFRRINISCISDLYKPDIRKRIEFFEKAISVFDNSLEVRFKRSKNFEISEVIRELNFILNSFKIPLFCYNFSGKVGGNMNLDHFIGGDD